MPRTYNRISKRGKWHKEDLENAINFVNNGGKIREAARKFDIPYASLQTRIKNQMETIIGPKMGRKPIFTEEQEIQISNYLKLMANTFYGFTQTELRTIAYAYVEKNNIKHNFNRKRMTGTDWSYRFMKRNSTITKRKPQTNTVFNIEEIELFFNQLEVFMDQYKFSPTKIFNVDETEIQNVEQSEIILAKEGQRMVHVICAMNASGTYIPPMFIFPYQSIPTEFPRNEPPGAIYDVSNNGCSNTNLFLIWLEHFTGIVKPTTEDPVLLILDNHTSHISLDIFEFCKNNGIIILCIPLHASHRMQPLDVTFFGPLKSMFKKECYLYLKLNKTEKITNYQLVSIFNKAYTSVAVRKLAISGFAASGILPLNRNIFGDENFLLLNSTETDLSNSENILKFDVLEDNSLLMNNLSEKSTSPKPGTSKTNTEIEDICHLSISTTKNIKSTQSSQLEKILQFMEQNPDLAINPTEGPNAKLVTNKLWKQLETILNAETRPKRTLEHWQATFSDWKTNCKKKLHENYPLNSMERRLLALLGIHEYDLIEEENIRYEFINVDEQKFIEQKINYEVIDQVSSPTSSLIIKAEEDDSQVMYLENLEPAIEPQSNEDIFEISQPPAKKQKLNENIRTENQPDTNNLLQRINQNVENIGNALNEQNAILRKLVSYLENKI